MLVEELSQLRHDHRTDARMTAPFALLQTLLRGLVPQAVEAFGVIKVKVVPADARFEPEEILDSAQLWYRVLDQLITVHYEDLLPGEHLQPAMHVSVIERDGHRSVGFVNRTIGSHNELLESARRLLLQLRRAIVD